MRWNCMSKALHFLQITAEHKDYPFFTVFLTTKSLSQNISITLLQISLKLHEHQGGYCRKKLPWMILEEQFPVPRNTSVTKIGNSIISLLGQLQCHCNPDHNKFSSLSNTTVVAIFPKLCLRQRSLCSNLGGIGLEKLYQATLSRHPLWSRHLGRSRRCPLNGGFTVFLLGSEHWDRLYKHCHYFPITKHNSSTGVTSMEM